MAVNCVALFVAVHPGASESLIRLNGLSLQLLGIGTVIWGIAETRALFGQPPILAKSKLWLDRFPLLHGDVALATASGELTSLTGKARGHTVANLTGERNVENRLYALERNVVLIHQRITATERGIDEEIRHATDALKQEGVGGARADSELRKTIEASGTGGLHISAIGASWLFVEIILSTAFGEIAAFLRDA